MYIINMLRKVSQRRRKTTKIPFIQISMKCKHWSKKDK